MNKAMCILCDVVLCSMAAVFILHNLLPSCIASYLFYPHYSWLRLCERVKQTFQEMECLYHFVNRWSMVAEKTQCTLSFKYCLQQALKAKELLICCILCTIDPIHAEVILISKLAVTSVYTQPFSSPMDYA